MFHRLIKLLLVFVFFIGNEKLNGQTFFGLQNSNYGGVNLIYTNPSAIAMMPQKRSANIGGFGFNVDNNYLSLETPFSLWQLVNNNVDDQYRNANGGIDWQSSWLKEQGSVSEIWANVGMEFRGPAYANKFGDRFAWGTATRTRSTASIRNVSPELITWAKNLMDSTSVPNILNFATNSMTLSANSFQEISGVFAFRAIDADALKLAFGATAKIILGMGSFNINNSGPQFKTYGIDSISLSGGTISASYTDNNVMQQMLKGVLLGSLPNFNNINGFGYGFDLGFSMEFGGSGSSLTKGRYRDHKLRIAGSVLDLGKISYNNKSTGFELSGTPTVTMPLNTPEFVLAAVQGSEAVFDHVIEYAKSKGAYKSIDVLTAVNLPATVQLQADYQIVRYINVAAHWKQALNLDDPFTVRTNSSLVVVPRFEHAWFEFSVPLSIYNNYRKFGMGGFMRLGPVFIGTDNFLNSLSATKFTGMNMYFGFSTLIP